MPQRISIWLIPGLIGLVCLAVRIRLLPVPLERDEGEYAYVASRLLDGAAPYTEAYSLKMPGIHLVYAAILGTLGGSPTAIHVGLLLANATSVLFLFLLARRLWGPGPGICAASSFAVLSLGASVQGVFANAEHFVLPSALAGWWMLHRGVAGHSPRDTLLAGALLGLAVVVKQHAVLFLLGGLGVAALSEGAGATRLRRVGLATGGAIVPPLLVGVWLAARGSLDEGIFWTVTYARKYVGSLPVELGMKYLSTRGGHVVTDAWPIVLGGLLGLGLFARRGSHRFFLALFVTASCLATVPGLYFRPHYFVLALPAIALVFAASTTQLPRPPWGARGALVLAVGLTLVMQRGFLLATPQQALRACYGIEPFLESVEIGRELRRRTEPDDTIAVFGSEPQICHYARRRSASGHIYMYPLMETHDYARPMQEQMIREVRAAEPAMLVFVNFPTSWVATEGSDRHIMDWAQQYWRRFYDRVGLVELPGGAPARFYWDGDAARLPQTRDWIGIFRRRDAG